MRTIKFLFILTAVVLFITNCSKDKRLERTLYKKEGTWNIASVTWNLVQQDTSGQIVKNGTIADAGTFIFEKNGSGSYDYTVDGTQHTGTFSYSVDDETITISYISMSLFGNISQFVLALTGTQTGKDNIELEGSETSQYVSGSISQSVLTGTYSLTKQ